MLKYFIINVINNTKTNIKYKVFQKKILVQILKFQYDENLFVFI